MSESSTKILFIIHLPPPVHGSAVVGKYLKESELINSQFESKFTNLSTSRTIEDIGKKGLVKIVQYFKIIDQAFKQLLFFKPDLVYVSMTAKGIGFYKDLPIILLIKLFGKQLVIHFHNKGVRLNQNRLIDNWLYSMVFRNTKVILLSRYLYADVHKYVKEQNVYYCANGIPVIKEKPKNISEKNTVQLLFLSNLIESKGVFLLLEALKVLKNEKLSFNCSFVGAKGDISLDQFQLKVEEFSLSSCVNYLGSKSDYEKHAILSKSDIFVLPSLNDCFPLVILEAMQFGLPVVSTLEGAIPEIVDDGITGFLVPKNDANTLAEKLKALIKDSDLRKRLGEAGKSKFLERYTLEHFEKQMRTILMELIAKNN